MHILVVLDHPDQNSFSHAVAASFMAGAHDAGHSVELADLHAEGFDPRWTLADHNRKEDEPLPRDVLFEQQRIERCDALCMVFPLFWYGMPAMSKGWLERVWAWGWAYDQLDDFEKSLQKARTGLLLIPAGAASDEMDEYNLTDAMDTIWRTGTLGFFGFKDKRLKFLHGSTGALKRREGLLEQAYQEGLTMELPDKS